MNSGYVGRHAILIDGEFAKKLLRNELKRAPSAEEIMAMCELIQSHVALQELDLFRIYYYTADPFGEAVTNPLSGETTDYGKTDVFKQNQKLHQALERKPNVALRRGSLNYQGWELGRAAMNALKKGNKSSLTARDLVPKIRQKGVDSRIGLDIAALALKKIVGTITLVTGDSDFVPAMKLARREGLRVYLYTMGSVWIRQELKTHADLVLETSEFTT